MRFSYLLVAEKRQQQQNILLFRAEMLRKYSMKFVGKEKSDQEQQMKETMMKTVNPETGRQSRGWFQKAGLVKTRSLLTLKRGTLWVACLRKGRHLQPGQKVDSILFLKES